MLFRLVMAYRGTMSYLHIAQKNSIAKEVASILSEGNKRTANTLSKYNPVFLFERDGSNHTFSSVRGHLFEYQLPPECKSWYSFDNAKILTRQVPMVKKPGDDMNDLLRNLERIATGKKQLILWLDCDREGEAIAFEVIDVIRSVNPTIRIRRARFAAVTRTDIIRAWDNLIEPNILEADAVNYRIEMDFRMGCAFTRYQTITLSKRVKFKEHQVVSYGPCQMPTLGFVVDRYLQIKYFKPQKYWLIKAVIILTENTGVELKWQRNNTRSEEQANLMFFAMFQNAHQGGGKIVGKILERNKKEKKKYRPYPLTTVAFQKLATDKLKLSSAEAMKIAQKLYQKGFISYPRTETNAFPATMNLKNLIQRLGNCHDYESYVNNLLNNRFKKPKMGSQNDQAHTPIHPVKPADPTTLTRQQWKVYDLISRHFLACCSEDAVGIQSQIIAEIGKERFKASHLTIKQKNYLEIYPFEKWAQSDFPGEIPDQFEASVELIQNQTKPPGYLTESELITLMEKNQIGTDATIHQHIETIQQRKYALKQGNTFRPTNLGASLIVTYKALQLHLEDCHIRRLIEQRMDKIAIGELERNDAALNTLAQVGPLYEKLKHLQETWLEKMQSAMNQHSDLRQIETNHPVNMPNNQSDDEFSNLTNNTANRFICFTCGEPGHTSNNCPRKGRPKSPSRQKSPAQRPHSRYPPANREDFKTTSFSGIVCYSCKEPGHLTTQCPNRQRSNYQTGQEEPTSKKFTCFICGEQGHFAPNCPQKNNPKETRENIQQKGTCYSCGQSGHFSSNCPNKGITGKFYQKQDQQDKKLKQLKPKKKCQFCGIEGRHPRGAACPAVRQKKNASDNQYD